MTPLSFEWLWNIEYLIFMGLLYLALMIVGAGVIYTYIKTWMDMGNETDEIPPKISSRSKYTNY